MIGSIRAGCLRHLWPAAFSFLCAIPAHAGLFSDDEARTRINALGSRVDDVSQRVDAVSHSQVDFSNQIESIKTDIAKLRGQVDELNYNLDAAQKRQKDFYVDLDNRLRKFESQGQADQNKAEASKAVDEAAMREYESALTALKASDCKKAVAGFESFMSSAPNHPQQPGAHFFAGFCYGNMKQSAKAAEMYRLVADNWPDDEHAPDAMLARAEIIDQAGQHKEARMVLAKLVAKYPSSDAARQAKIRLKKK